MRLRVKHWSNFQHYSDRCPPWIKLHYSLISSRTWVVLDDASRVLAIACMLIASQDSAKDGSFDADPEFVQRVAYLKKKPDYKQLLETEFLETLDDASDCKQMQADDTTEERRGEKRRSAPLNGVKKFIKPTMLEVTDYCQQRRNGIDPESFIAFYESKGWKVGNSPMKDWKAAVITWEKREGHKPQQQDQFSGAI